jgi:hypothetical protein
MPDSIILSCDVTSETWLPLEDLAPGTRGAVSITVTFNGPSDADVALYSQGETTGALAQRLRLSIFESTATLMPFPVFNGTLADLSGRTSYADGLGRWTGHGDGRDHTVTYEVMWSLPKDADVPDDEPKLGLVFEARGRMS